MIAEAAAAGVTVDLGAILQGLTIAILLWFFTSLHQIKEQLSDLKRETKEWQAKVEVGLFGATGENGLHGLSKDHEQRIRLLEQHHLNS